MDLYIVHKAIQLPRTSTKQQESKQNKNHKKQNTQKTTKQKNSTKNRANGQLCALEMNSDSSLCAILRAGHLKSKHKTQQNKTTKNGHGRVRKQQDTLRKPRIPPARIPEITPCSRRGMTQHLCTSTVSICNASEK